MENEIFALEQNAMERWRRGDPLGWAEICSEDVIYINPSLTQPVVGMQACLAYSRPLVGKIHYQGSEFIEPDLMLYGDAAVLTYNYRATTTAPDGAVLHQTPSNATEVYFRRAGQWQMVHSHWSYTRHKLPERLEIPLPVQMAPQAYEGVLGELMALESAAMQRWRTGDPGGFVELYAPEATYFDTGTPQRINGHEALAAEMASRAGKIYYDVQDFIDPRVRVQGDLALLSYRFLSTRLNPDGSVASRTPWNCSEVYLRRDGRWQIVHNHWSLIHGERIES